MTFNEWFERNYPEANYQNDTSKTMRNFHREVCEKVWDAGHSEGYSEGRESGYDEGYSVRDSYEDDK